MRERFVRLRAGRIEAWNGGAGLPASPPNVRVSLGGTTHTPEPRAHPARAPATLETHMHKANAFLVVCAGILLLALAHVPASAQAWNEVGDAGALPATAQVTVGAGALTTLAGNLDSPTDVDMYCVRVTDPAAFVACLQCLVIQGPNLWIFDSNGKGVAANTTCQAGCKNVTSGLVTLPGTYYVAVAYDQVYPYSGADVIWNPAYVPQRPPDGPGAAGVVTSWAGTPNVQPQNPYLISFSGGVGYCSSVTPAQDGTWGLIKQIYR